MNPHAILRTMFLAALTAFGCWALYRVGLAADALRLPDVAPTLARANTVLENADAATKNLADATGDWSDASKEQTRDVRAALAAGGRLLDATTEDAKALKPAIQSVQKTADAATGLTLQATSTLQTIDSKAGPLLDAYAGAGRDLDAMIQDNSPSVKTVLVNFAGMTDSGNGILADGKKVADKETAEYLKAHTPWGTVARRLWGAYDITSWIAANRP